MTQKDKINCSVGILAFNSGKNLRRCLASVANFDEIIIADGGSTDETLEIARNFNAVVISQSNPGHSIEDFAKERQRMLDASTKDWFFYLDSDEKASAGLVEEIRVITEKNASEPLVYKVPYSLSTPDIEKIYKSFKTYYQNRFFNKRSGAYFIKKVHERIAFTKNQKIGTLQNPWYVPLDDQLDFKVYKRKVDYRLAILASDWNSKNPLKFIFQIVLGQILGVLKQIYKTVFLKLKYSKDEIVPLRYEIFRLYSPYVILKEFGKRYFKLVFASIKVNTLRLWRIVRKLLAGKNVRYIEQNKEGWDRQYSEGKWNFLLDRQKNIDFISEKIRQIAGGKNIRVLDVGCGNGALLKRISQISGLSYAGIDISEVAIKSLASEYPDATLIAGNIQTDDFSTLTGSFNVIVFAEILCYVDYAKVLERFEKYAETDSKVIISLYKSWRSFFIWRAVKKSFHVDEVRIFERDNGKVKWKVAVCRYK